MLPQETDSNTRLTYSRRSHLAALLAAGVMCGVCSGALIVQNESIFNGYSCLLVLICCDVALWILRGTTFLVELFPCFHYVSLGVEFVEHVLAVVYLLVGTISWCISLFNQSDSVGGLLTRTISALLVILVLLRLLYLLTGVPYVLIKGGAEQWTALSMEECPRHDLILPEQHEMVDLMVRVLRNG